MTRNQWLFRLRCLNNIDSLDKVIEKKNYELRNGELIVFMGAADHRLAEIITGQLYDKVPKNIWHLVR